MRKNKRHEEEEHVDESWLVPYADILTLLLALFIVLFASSEIDAQKYSQMREVLNKAFNGGTGVLNGEHILNNNSQQPSVEQTSTTDAELMELKEQLDRYIQENNLDIDLETYLSGDSLILTIRDHALFESGSAQVKPGAKKTIAAISNMLQQYPRYEVIVSGHTDNVPIKTREFESNWDLSSHRALNCMNILLLNTQLDPYRFSAVGYGEYRPVAANDTAAGRAKNRRVEVAIKGSS